MSDLLSPLVADIGGNSHFSRSARAKLQWRDRYGKFIEMGKGIKFKFRRPDGTTVSSNGVFVGSTNDPNVGQIYVSKDPNGLKDGFYNVSSANAQEILGTLDPTALKQQGVTLGQHVDGTPIGDRLDTDIPNEAQLPYSNAPTGWTAHTNGPSIMSWTSDDGEFTVRPASYPLKQKTGKTLSLYRNNQSIGSYQNWAQALDSVNQQDASGPQFDNNAALEANRADIQAGQDVKAAHVAEINAAPDAKAKALAAVKPYDPTGNVADLIHRNGSAKDILNALDTNAQWKHANSEHALKDTKDFPTKIDKANADRHQAILDAINNLDKSQDSVTPDSSTGHNLDLSVGDVAATGYLVPTKGNEQSVKSDDISAESVAAYIVQHKEELAQGGKRLSITTDTDDPNALFDIVDQVADHNSAQQLASQRDVTEITDVANNKVISTAQGRPREDGTNSVPNSDAKQSGTDESGSDHPVDQSNGGSDQAEGAGPGPDSVAPAAPQGGNPNSTSNDSNSAGRPAADSSAGQPNSGSSNTDSGPSDNADSNTPSKPASAEHTEANPSDDNKQVDAAPKADAPAPAAGDARKPVSKTEDNAPAAPSTDEAQAPAEDDSTDHVPGVRPMDPAKVQQAELDDDGLPNDPNALDRTILRLEARAATVDGPALDMLNSQLDRAYAKKNGMDGGKDTPATDAPDTGVAKPEADKASTPATPEAAPAPKNELRDRLEKAKAKTDSTPAPADKPADNSAPAATPAKKVDAPAPEPQKAPEAKKPAEKPFAPAPEKPDADPKVEAAKNGIAIDKGDKPAPAGYHWEETSPAVAQKGQTSPALHTLVKDDPSTPEKEAIGDKATEQAANAPASPPKDAAAHEANIKRLEGLVKRRKTAVEKHESNYGSSNIPASSSYKPEHLRRMAAHRSAQDELTAARRDAADHANGVTPPARVDHLTRDQHQARMESHQKIADTPKREGELPKDAQARREQALDQVGKHKRAIDQLDQQSAQKDATPAEQSPETSPESAEPDTTNNTPEVQTPAPEQAQENTPTPAPTPAAAPTPTPEQGDTPRRNIEAEQAASADPLVNDLQEAHADVAAANRMAVRARARGDEAGAQRYEAEAKDAQQDVDDLQRMLDRRNRQNNGLGRPAPEAAPEPTPAPEPVNTPEPTPTPAEPVNVPEEPTAAPEAPSAPDNAPEAPVADEPVPNAEDIAPEEAPLDATPQPAVQRQLVESGPTDGTDSSFVNPDNNVAEGNIALSSDGKYVATANPDTPNVAQAFFDDRPSAEQWLGSELSNDGAYNPVDDGQLTPNQTTPTVYRGADAAPVPQHQSRIADSLLEGKNLPAEQKVALKEALDNEDLNQGQYRDLVNQISDLPAAPNTQSKPRDAATNPVNFTQSNPALVDVDPGKIIDPNLIMQDVKRNHPGYKQLANGDVVIESRQINGKTYDLIVRRTRGEHFYPYIRETDDATGVARVLPQGHGVHSYKALITKMNTAKAQLRSPRFEKAFPKKLNKSGLEIPADAKGDFSVVPDPGRDFIEHTNIARSKDEHANQMVSLVADMVHRGEDRKVIDAVAARNDLSPEFVDNVVAAVDRKRANDAIRLQAENAAIAQKSHIPYGGGEALKVGDWVDWVDNVQNNKVTDKDGNVSFVPNPNFNRVYRGRVVQVRYVTNDGRYAYSDSTYVDFPELENQRSRVSSQLKRVDGPNAPLSAPFNAKADEKAQPEEQVVTDFNMPNAPLVGESLPELRPRSLPAANIEPSVDINGNLYVGSDDAPIAISDGPADLRKELAAAQMQSLPVSSLQAGDLFYRHVNGSPTLSKVVSVKKNEDGTIAVQSVYHTPVGLAQKTTNMHAHHTLLVGRKVEAPDNNELDGEADGARSVGDRVMADDIPGVTGVITAISAPGINGERTYTIKADSNGAEYPRQERYIQNAPSASELDAASIQPASKQGDEAWKRDVVSEKQRAYMRSLLSKKEVSPASRAQVLKALNNPDLTKGQASGMIDELKNHKDKGAVSSPAKDEVNIRDIMQQVADMLKADPEANADGADVQNALDNSKQAKVDADAVPTDSAFGGYNVRAITYSQIDTAGRNAKYKNLKKINGSDLKVGDLIPQGVGQYRRYSQVLEIGRNGRLKVRMITQADSPYAPLHGNVKEMYINPYRAINNVKAPTASNTNYFKDGPAVAPQKPKAAHAPLVSGDYEGRAEEIRNRFNAGYDQGEQNHDGAMNAGAFVVQPVDGGPKLFMKNVNPSDPEEWDREILASKILNAFGHDGPVVIGLPDRERVVQDLVSGDIAARRRIPANDILNNMEDYPNARLIGLFDYLGNNSDRHMGNWFVNDQGQPVAIDHGHVWFRPKVGRPLRSPFAQKALGKLIGGRDEPMFEKAELENLRAQVEDLRSEFSAYGNKRGSLWYSYVMRRFDSLIAQY